MSAIFMSAMIDNASEVQTMTHDMSVQLRQIAGFLPEGHRREIRLLAAVAELASDRANMIVENMKNDF